MLRTLIAGALIGFAGKKLYESGKLDEFKNDLKTRLKLDENRAKPDPAAPATPRPVSASTPA